MIKTYLKTLPENFHLKCFSLPIRKIGIRDYQTIIGFLIMFWIGVTHSVNHHYCVWIFENESCLGELGDGMLLRSELLAISSSSSLPLVAAFQWQAQEARRITQQELKPVSPGHFVRADFQAPAPLLNIPLWSF